MNFFEQQHRARRAARHMVLLFALSVGVVVAAVDAVVLLVAQLEGAAALREARIPLVLASSVITLLAIGAASLYRMASLRSGGSAVARALGGTPVPAQTTSFAWKRLRNVVEEIAIAAGVPVPQIYVLEREAAINAFAAGYTPADAAIAVSQGALDKLTRDELQGVIAHEFSHILNGDARLNIRMMGLLFGILLLAMAGRKILEHGGRGSRDGGGVVAAGIGLLVVGSIGLVCARLIKASISRSREFLADASAVQFTRQSHGIGGALKKIAALGEGSRLVRAETEEVAHMLFGDGVGYSRWFATHPPLLQRIVRIDPGFEPAELALIAKAWSTPMAGGESTAVDASIAGLLPALPASQPAPTRQTLPAVALPSPAREISLSALRVVAQVGHPGADDFDAAAMIHAGMPDILRAAAADPARADVLLLALILAAAGQERLRQLQRIARTRDTQTRDEVAALAMVCDGLHPLQRLALAGLAFPALRHRPTRQLQQLTDLLEALCHSDGQIDLAEYCLLRLIQVLLADALSPPAARSAGGRHLTACRQELRVLFAVLADRGHADAAAAQRAYARGIGEVLPGESSPLQLPTDWVIALDRALAVLNQLRPLAKQQLVLGLTRTVGEDGRVSIAEAELLRTVCAVLHCPLSPLVKNS